MRFISRGLLLLVAVLAHAASAQDTTDARAQRVDSLFAIYNRTPSPGLALAVVRDGRVVLRRGYGLADVEHGVPITPATVFDVASVAKQFTGLAVAMLVSQRKIALGDAIRRYIPELHDFDHPIRVEQLVHHTSGIRDWPGALAVAGWRFDDVITFDEILDMAYRQRTLNFTPGAEHLYSNTGYNLLAELVHRVSGRPFAEWTEAQIFRPLGMTDTHFRTDYGEVIPRRAYGYERIADGRYRLTTDDLVAPGSSSLFSTVDDLARWLINFDDAGVGGRDAIALMQTPGKLNDGTSVPYGFGILTGSYRGLPMFTHSGGWASFDTYTVYLPQQRLGIVVLANCDAISAQRAVIDIANIYLEHDFPPAAASPVSEHSAVATAPTASPATDTLAGYAGLYRFGPGSYVRIVAQGAAATAQRTGEKAAGLTAQPDGTFTREESGGTLVFARDARRHPAVLTWDGDSARKVAPVADAKLASYAGEYESAELGARYRIETRGDTLMLWHPRIGRIVLTRLWGDDFAGTTWYLRSVEFQRDRRGRIVALVVNGDPRNRDIRFLRVG
jgi:CubicO group peptidase (beta-lactamase class C family)